ncbi:DUF4913 domain-containing protein [Paeniglutamicibacter gangotriensis]|uniref:DUF4913 domain-containing protein n=1 Tax=Paeniglutamicibacter gangotriensis TaxID=254787 RepID=A0A5B0E269_9MICC|nr:DUF4913 domain-containing protein [Paeniglutamicibacter gangotriensis]
MGTQLVRLPGTGSRPPPVQALWVTWEQVKLDGPQAILVYYRDHFYPLMDRLTSPDGPFHALMKPRTRTRRNHSRYLRLPRDIPQVDI